MPSKGGYPKRPPGQASRRPRARYSETAGWGNYSDPLYFRAVLSSEPPSDKVVYFVRVLRGTEDPPDWPPPPNMKCVEVQQASLELGAPSGDGWTAVAALTPGGGRRDGRDVDAVVATAASMDGWQAVSLIRDGRVRLREDAGEGGPTAGSTAESSGGGWRADDARLYDEGRYEVIRREGVEILPGWTALLGPGGPLMPGPELRAVTTEPSLAPFPEPAGVVAARMAEAGIGEPVLSTQGTSNLSTGEAAILGAAISDTGAGEPVISSPSAPAVPGAETRASGSRLIGQTAVEKEVLFFHNDHLGSPIAVTNLEGMLVARHEYGPFGEELEPAAAKLHTRRFTSHERDDESGLDYMLSRYYAAPLGRFLSVDPAAESARRDAPQTWNRYAYVANNPLRYNDPTGEDGNDVANWIDQQIQSVVNLVDAHTNEGTFTTLANDAVTAAGALASGAVDMLRVGAATGEAVGSAQGGTDLARAVSQDVARGAALFVAIGSAAEGAGLNARGASGSSQGLGNPFKGKTPEQVDGMFKAKGFEPKGPDPVSGKGGYVNPETGRSYHIDRANRFGEGPHVDVNRPRGYKGPLEKKKYPMGE